MKSFVEQLAEAWAQGDKQRDTEVAEIMELAADGYKSDKYGWTQGCGSRGREDGGEGRCMMMALDRANIQVVGNSNHYQSLYFLLNQRLDQSPVGWNDTPGRTKEEVIDLLDTVAKDLRNRA